MPTPGEVADLREYLAKRAQRCTLSSPRAAPRRNRMLVELLLCTGLRASEVGRLVVSDLDLGADPHVKVRGGKKRAPKVVETVPVPFAMVGPLLQYLEGLAPDAPVFCCDDGHPMGRKRVWEVVKTAWRAVGARSALNAHALRHYFITQLAQHPKGTPFEVARLARMRDLTTVLEYFHEKAGRELVESLGGALPRSPARARAIARDHDEIQRPKHGPKNNGHQ